MLRLSLIAAVLVCALVPTSASAATTWLCHPDRKDVCDGSLHTENLGPTAEVEKDSLAGTYVIPEQRMDCFYVYPTVSDQKTPIANKRIDPELRSIALYQAARYAQKCRVFAPVYRQRTIQGIQPGAAQGGERRGVVNPQGYADVLAAWREYLRKDNKGRGVVLIGHSQGTFVLRRLIAREIDRSKRARERIVSALLLGGNVLVRKGSDRGGDFQNMPACRTRRQIGCVVAFSVYDEPPPADALFARTTEPNREILCTNPASLGGGSGTLTTIVPSAPFAPGTSIAAGISLLGFPKLTSKERWIEIYGAYRAQCVNAGGATSLQVTAIDGGPDLRPSPTPAWGLHLVDANLALGNLLDLVAIQGRAWRSADRARSS